MNKTIALIVGSLAISGCSDSVVDPIETFHYSYVVPPEIGDGWQTDSLNTHGFDIAGIEDLIEAIMRDEYGNVHSIVIVRHGHLLLESYFPGIEPADHRYKEFDSETLHSIASITKSVTSLLVGSAIDSGLIDSVESKIQTYFPEYSDIDWYGAKGRMTVGNLLTMTTGFSWTENGPGQTGSIHEMGMSSDPIRYVLSQPMDYEPGSVWEYCSGASTVLGALVGNASAMRVDSFADSHLFAPLGIEDRFWFIHQDGTVWTGGGLMLRPRDMAKFGQLVLNGGLWGEQRLISEDWIDHSTRKRVTPTGGYTADGYGYQWWTDLHSVNDVTYNSISARGYAGQMIFIFEDLDLVLAFTGGNTNNGLAPVLGMIEEHIIPALRN